MIDYFSDHQYEGGYCFQLESIAVMNPDVKQCNEIIDDLESILWCITKERDRLKEL